MENKRTDTHCGNDSEYKILKDAPPPNYKIPVPPPTRNDKQKPKK